MPIVVDSNLLVAVVSGDPRGDRVSEFILDCIERGLDLHAPALARYEVANAFTRLIVASAFPAERVDDAWSKLSVLPIMYHPLTEIQRVVEISLLLGRQSAYDAAYVALTEELEAALCTLDRPLYRNAVGFGFAVRLLT